jgi:hypothetical protein
MTYQMSKRFNVTKLNLKRNRPPNSIREKWGKLGPYVYVRSYSSDNEENYFLGRNAVQFIVILQTFSLPHSEGVRGSPH